METILGGEPSPEPAEGMSPPQMRDHLLSATLADASASYDGCARYAAKLILEFFLAEPKRATLPTENVYRRDENNEVDWSNLIVEQPGLYEVMKEAGVSLDALGLSGFMWGWAVNAARYCVELEAVPNPAIVTIGGGQ